MLLQVSCSRPCWLCVTESGRNSANSSSNASWSTWQVATPLQEWGQTPFPHLSRNASLCHDMSCNCWLCFCAPISSPLLVFLKDKASSHLVETIIQLSHKSLLRDLYKNHLKGQLVDLALHSIANFPIQRLTAASAKYKLVGHNVCVTRCRIRVGILWLQGLLPFSFSLSFSVVPEVVWWADPRRGGHLGCRSHGCDRPTGRELCRKWRETGGDDAVPPPCKRQRVFVIEM